MTGTLGALRHQIGTAEELRSVVRTMKVLAASSIGQYQNSVRALGDYARTAEIGLGACLRHVGPTAVGPARGAPGRPRTLVAVVFGSDQGLVGQFNEVVAEHAVRSLAGLSRTARVWAVGERVHARLVDAGLAPAGLFAVPRSVKGITALVADILVSTQAHEAEGAIIELHLFHNRSAAGALHTPVSRRVLPLDEAWRLERVELPWPTATVPEVLGGAGPSLGALIGEYLFVTIFRACAESLASENASRLAAMQRAATDIDDRLEELHRHFQRLRQSGIDEELFDVIAGYQALAMG